MRKAVYAAVGMSLFLLAESTTQALSGNGADFIGIFKNPGAISRTVKIAPQGHGFHIDVSVMTPTCGGHIVGKGKAISSSELVLRSIPEYKGQTICRVHIKATANLDAVDLSEIDCGYFHGRTCGFLGHVLRSKK